MLKGICDICGKPGELLTCAKCGKRVCKEHYRDGLCTECSKGEGMPRGGGGQLVVPQSEKPTTVTPGDIKK